jgi:hypothetical protein
MHGLRVARESLGLTQIYGIFRNLIQKNRKEIGMHMLRCAWGLCECLWSHANLENL